MDSFFGTSAAELEDLIGAVQADRSNDSAAMSELLRRFESLALKIGRSLSSDCHTREDLANAARWGLVLAVRAHTPSTVGFAAYARRYMWGEARRRQRVPRLTEIPVDISTLVAVGAAHESPDYTVDSPWGFGQVAVAVLDQPAGRQQLLRERYVNDLTQQDMAVRRGISVSAVNQQLRVTFACIRQHLATAA